MANISSAARGLDKSEINALRKALQASEAKVALLESEKTKLKQIIKDLSTDRKTKQQRIKSLEGKVRSQHEKIHQQKLTIKRQQRALEKHKIKAGEPRKHKVQTPKIVSEVKFTREQIFEKNRNANVTRFLERVNEIMSPTQEELAKLTILINSLSDADLRSIIRIAHLRSTYYDSDNNWNVAELTSYTGIEELIEQFKSAIA